MYALSSSLEIFGLSAEFENASTLGISWDPVPPQNDMHGYDVMILKDNMEVRRVGVDDLEQSVKVPSLNQCFNYTVKVAVNYTAGPGNYSSIEVLTRCGKYWQTFQCYCAFHKHANSKVQTPPSQLRFSLPSIIITITSNEP